MPKFTKRFFGWVLQATVKTAVGAVLGSAAVTALLNWAVQEYLTLTWSALAALWTGTMFLSYLAFLWMPSRFPSWLSESPASVPKIPAIPESWTPWYEQPLTVVHHKTFENQDVPLDGYRYEHCKFRNVTFRITGAGMSQ